MKLIRGERGSLLPHSGLYPVTDETSAEVPAVAPMAYITAGDWVVEAHAGSTGEPVRITASSRGGAPLSPAGHNAAFAVVAGYYDSVKLAHISSRHPNRGAHITANEVWLDVTPEPDTVRVLARRLADAIAKT